MDGTDDGQPVFGLGILDGVAAGQDATALAHGRGGTGEDGRHRLARQFLGEGGDAQGEEDAAAHGVDVAHRVGCGDGAERGRIVDQRWEEIERADDGQLVAQSVDGGVVGGVEADEEGIGGRLGAVAIRGPECPEAGQRLGQDVGAQLGGAATAARLLGQRQAGSVGGVTGRRGHGRPMIRGDPGTTMVEPTCPADVPTQVARRTTMASSDAATPDAYLAALPADRRHALTALRDVIRANLPPGYVEGMQYGMIGYFVPLDRFPDTYNGQPLGLAGLASQKGYMSLYLNTVYGDPETDRWFRERYAASGKKLDMGKSCVRFRRLDDLPLDLIGETIARVPVDRYVERYRAVRGSSRKTRASAS